jgi:hypothetical protein
MERRFPHEMMLSKTLLKCISYFNAYGTRLPCPAAVWLAPSGRVRWPPVLRHKGIEYEYDYDFAPNDGTMRAVITVVDGRTLDGETCVTLHHVHPGERQAAAGHG